MQKEVFFAVLTGALLGILLAFGIWRTNSKLKPPQNGTNTQTQTLQNTQASSTSKPAIMGNLAITSPQHEEVFTENQITIAGVASSNSEILISTQTLDFYTKSDSSGNFQKEIDLIGGLNNIVIASFDSKGEKSQKVLSVVYTTELPSVGTPKPLTTADPIRQKLQEELDLTTSKPNAFIGSVTDKTQSSLQIKNGNGEIRQASIFEASTKFVRLTTTSKEVSFNEVAIGDFIVAIGYKTSSGTLDAYRVLLITSEDVTKRILSKGVVTKLTSKQLTLKETAGNEQIIKPQSNVRITTTAEKPETLKFTSLKLDDNILVSGTLTDTGTTSRTIFVLQ